MTQLVQQEQGAVAMSEPRDVCPICRDYTDEFIPGTPHLRWQADVINGTHQQCIEDLADGLVRGL